MVGKDTDAEQEKSDATSENKHCQDSEIVSEPSADDQAAVERWSKEAANQIEQEKQGYTEDGSSSSSRVTSDGSAEVKDTVDIKTEESPSTQAQQSPEPAAPAKRRAMVPIALLIILLCASLLGIGFIQYRAKNNAAKHVTSTDKRLADLNQAIERDHNNPEPYFERAKLFYFDREEAGNALADLDRVIQMEPNRLDAYLLRADVETFLHHFVQAKADVEKANKLAPNSADVCMQRAHVEEVMEDHNRAVADCQKAFALKPDHFLAYGVLADAYDGLGRYPEAIQCVTRQLELHKEPHPWPLNYFSRGLLKLHARDFDGAISDENESLRISPKLGTALIVRAFAEAAKGDIPLAEADAAQGLIEETVPARGHRLVGDLYEYLDNPERAIEEYGKGISLNPLGEHTFRARGIAYYRLGQLQNALEDLQYSVKLNPSATSLSYLALVEAELGDDKNADRDMSFALSSSSPTSFVYSNQAAIMRKRGKLDEALACARKALAMDQYNADAYQVIGEVHKEQGEFQEAQKDFDKAKQYGYPGSAPPPAW